MTFQEICSHMSTLHTLENQSMEKVDGVPFHHPSANEMELKLVLKIK